MKPATLIFALLPALAGCDFNNSRPVATPRPEAFPRIETYAPEFRTLALPFGPDSLTVNAGAGADISPDGWIDIAYPAYGVTVRATLSPVGVTTVAEVLSNRLERLERNLGGARAQSARTGRGMVVVAPTALRTPVQLLATDSATWVLSAVAVADWPAGTDPDSVAPIVDALARDMTIMLNNL